MAYGKTVAGRLYIHRSAVGELTADQQHRIQAAVAVAGDISWNVAKLDLLTRGVSLLEYDNFCEDAFPELKAATTVDPEAGTVRHRSYPPERNRPVLHRKELLVPAAWPDRSRWAQLTWQLEAAGLLHDSSGIGYREQWTERLAQNDLAVADHELKTLDGQPLDMEKLSGIARQSTPDVSRHRTAIARSNLSSPMQALARHGFLDGQRTVFDYGCGRGDDLRQLAANAIPCAGWDPHYRPDEPRQPASIVNLGFVLNVIEDFEERAAVLQDAFSLAEELLATSVILKTSTDSAGGVPFADGIITSRGTFQRYFTPPEAADFIQEALDLEPIAVAPGVFFVFRDELGAQTFIEQRAYRRSNLLRQRASRPPAVRTSAAERHYARNTELLDRLWDQTLDLGREPVPGELDFESDIVEALGSIRRAVGILRKVYGEGPLAAARDARERDLRVLLALQQFQPRRRFKQWSAQLRTDIKAFFGSYASTIDQARALLFSIGDSDQIRADSVQAANEGVGWLHEDESALTLATKDIPTLSERLRVYIGCATQLYGDPESADLIKIHIDSAKLSLMRFDDFEGSALPRMTERVKLNFRDQTMQVFEYGEQHEPPYLYMKSRYLSSDYPNAEKQQRFDTLLLSVTELDYSGYGPPNRVFDRALRGARLEVQGFNIVPCQDLPDIDEPCGRYYSFRDFIECGETCHEAVARGMDNTPQQVASFNALADLARNIIDPVIDYFGGIELTFGFCSWNLQRLKLARTAPALDQHCAHEINRRGTLICPRLGAACDFLVRDEDMAEVAVWVAEQCTFDRLYFYGSQRPLHVSIGPQSKRQLVFMSEKPTGRRVPRVLHRATDLRNCLPRLSKTPPTVCQTGR